MCVGKKLEGKYICLYEDPIFLPKNIINYFCNQEQI